MTKEQLDKLHAIGKQVQAVCPDMYASVKFNLKPGRKDVNVNLEINESKILTNAK